MPPEKRATAIPVAARRLFRMHEAKVKKEILLALSVFLAGCQTGQLDDSFDAASAERPSTRRQVQPRLTKKEEACAAASQRAATAQANAAVLSTVLSVAGGLGGFGNHGGMIAGQAASIGGSVMQAQASSQIAGQCYG